MEKQLKCILLLSLKEMALRRVAVLLWNGSDILASISEFRLFRFSTCEGKEAWRKTVEDKIKYKMLKLELPESLTKQMIDIVRPIGLEVIAWKESLQYLFRALDNEISLPDAAELCWTTSGTINYRKTAEELLRCDKLNVKQRYEIACYHCLEDHISLCWEELPEIEKEMYRNDDDPLKYLPEGWSYILEDKHSKLDYMARKSDRNSTTFNQSAFENSAERCLKTAAEYFFQKLTQEDREASLVRTAHEVMANPNMRGFPYDRHSNVLCYLLSLMTPEQQMETIKLEPIRVFLCFLRWPLQDLVLDNAGLFWTFLQPSSYVALLEEIIYGYQSSYFYFPKMFEKFFKESPPDFKKCFVDEDSVLGCSPASRFLSVFATSMDSESIKVMFRNLDAADRVKLVFQRRVFSLFFTCMSMDGWHLVEVCLREATLSTEEKGRLKEAFTGFLERWQRGESQRKTCKRFFEFLDQTIVSSDNQKKGQKRKLENSSPEQ